jgi:hypothetical protein
MSETRMGALATYKDGTNQLVATTRDLDPIGEMVEVECEGKKTLAEFNTQRCALVDRDCLPGKCPL